MEWLSKRSAPNADGTAPIRIPKRAKRSLRRLRAKRSTTVNYDPGARHRRSKDDNGDCEPITDPNIDIEVVRAGRDINDNSGTHTRGSVLKVYCPSGFDLNLPKRKIRCKRGEWKPEMPVCRLVKILSSEHSMPLSYYTHGKKEIHPYYISPIEMRSL